MTIADEAVANALPCELVKYALRQSKDGIVISFVVHPNDIPTVLQTSHIGSRWMAAFVQVGDDEQPIPLAAKETKVSAASHARPQPVLDKSPVAAKPAWETMQPAQQAGIRSHDIRFAQFLEEEYPQIWREHQDAADCIRSICEVHSRAELGTNHAKRVLWHQLDKHFQAWDAKVRFNA